MIDDVLVVGASAAGLATVEALRRKGYAGRVTVLGAEAHLPYDRPPLSKQILGGRRPHCPHWTPSSCSVTRRCGWTPARGSSTRRPGAP
jgi:NADPH-dependent 2,4-dienoyl-CoA reductase/sulfur reductase-like enzyme